MAMVRKKQDDKYLEALRELITTGGGNRQCFDCGQKGPTYVNMTIGSFVCTRCSGVLRGITPPHRVKSISMATFTQDEIDFLKSHGNDLCAKTWLGLWDPKRAVHQDQRELMIDKYERKRYYLEPASPLKSLTNATNLKTTTAAATTSLSTSSSNSANNNQNNNNNRSNTNNNTHIQLTPPTSQRTTANGLHKTSSSAISRPQHGTVQAQNGFSTSQKDAFGLHNGLNSSVGSTSTGALSDTSSCASANGFGAEADFVADFSSADIFNATVASSPASSIASSTTTNNGYAKIQPIKTAQQQFMNGHSVASSKTSLQNGNLSNGNTENFADFDHAPIYNAAVEEPINYQFVRKNAIRKKSNSSMSGTILRRNERQLKDILEMDNNENMGDYINFEEEDVFGKSKTVNTATNSKSNQTPGYSNLFDDFDTLLTLDDCDKQKRQQQQDKGFESDYANTTKFTPLALAAHATAMAVLGNQSHFNQQLPMFENTITKPQTFTANQWDVWSQSTVKAPWFSYEQAHQQYPYASIDNYNRGNLLTQQQQQLHHQQQLQQQQQQQYQQQFSSNTFPTSTTLHPSSAINEATKTTTSSMPFSLTTVSATTTAAATTTTTSMLKQNSISTTTNPFRMHLDVNDIDNNHILNYYNSNIDYNYFQTTTTTLTPTSTTITTTTTIPTNFDNNINFNNNQNSDFVSNSIFSYNFQQISTTKTSVTTNNNSNTINSMTTMATTALPNQNYHCIDTDNNNNNNYIENSNLNLNSSNFYQNDNVNFMNSTTNPFSNSLNDTNIQQIQLNTRNLYPTTMTTTISSSYPSLITCNSSSANTATVTTSLESYSQKTLQNPFKTAPTLHSQQPFTSHHQNSLYHQRVVDENANIYMSSNINKNNINNNVVDNSKVVANNNSSNLNSNLYYDFNSNPKTNSISNSYLNSKQNVNDTRNLNNSWRLPINNNNNNKNSTTNGFNNNNINNNNNNNINNNNSSAPAEDRYAALKDLDEQLRESKAVAAQVASIVTANVVDSGFGNPNVNGTVNPFATHHHHHQQTAVANPFQNAPNNTAQNTTQQLFGQMTLIPNGIAAANGFLNTQKTHTANTGFFNYTASGFTNANTPQQLQQHQIQGSVIYPTSIQTGPNGCGFGVGNLQQQIASTGTGLTTNTFNNPFAATGALNSNNPFL